MLPIAWPTFLIVSKCQHFLQGVCWAFHILLRFCFFRPSCSWGWRIGFCFTRIGFHCFFRFPDWMSSRHWSRTPCYRTCASKWSSTWRYRRFGRSPYEFAFSDYRHHSSALLGSFSIFLSSLSIIPYLLVLVFGPFLLIQHEGILGFYISNLIV